MAVLAIRSDTASWRLHHDVDHGGGSLSSEILAEMPYGALGGKWADCLDGLPPQPSRRYGAIVMQNIRSSVAND